MSVLGIILREVLGLFVDDGWLALAIIAVVALAAIAALLPSGASAAGAILLFGCLAVLAANVASAARR